MLDKILNNTGIRLRYRRSLSLVLLSILSGCLNSYNKSVSNGSKEVDISPLLLWNPSVTLYLGNEIYSFVDRFVCHNFFMSNLQ